MIAEQLRSAELSQSHIPSDAIVADDDLKVNQKQEEKKSDQKQEEEEEDFEEDHEESEKVAQFEAPPPPPLLIEFNQQGQEFHRLRMMEDAILSFRRAILLLGSDGHHYKSDGKVISDLPMSLFLKIARETPNKLVAATLISNYAAVLLRTVIPEDERNYVWNSSSQVVSLSKDNHELLLLSKEMFELALELRKLVCHFLFIL